MKTTIAIIGAGGKMGQRCTENLARIMDVAAVVGAEGIEGGSGKYELLLCEKAEAAVARLREKGMSVTDADIALPRADFVVMAVPDTLLARISETVVPRMKAGATLIMLDPAVPCSNGIPIRSDLNYIVTHPCHPPLFLEQGTPEARRDYFGGIAGTQDIVIALMRGGEDIFIRGEAICRDMFAPVRDSHRVTVDQMAILEPALSEIVGAGCAAVMREAVEAAVSKGVPREAAMAFMLGHIQIALAIVFGAVSSPFSDAAKVAVELGKQWVFQPDWKKVFEPHMVQKAIGHMLNPETMPVRSAEAGTDG